MTQKLVDVLVRDPFELPLQLLVRLVSAADRAPSRRQSDGQVLPPAPADRPTPGAPRSRSRPAPEVKRTVGPRRPTRTAPLPRTSTLDSAASLVTSAAGSCRPVSPLSPVSRQSPVPQAVRPPARRLSGVPQVARQRALTPPGQAGTSSAVLRSGRRSAGAAGTGCSAGVSCRLWLRIVCSRLLFIRSERTD